MENSDVGVRRDIGSLADTLRKREPLLRLLADGPRDQRDLRDELDVSRSTIYKPLQKLRDADLIAERDGRYELTGFGRLAWQRHDDYTARLHRLSAGQRLIETLPDDRQFPLSIFCSRLTVLRGLMPRDSSADQTPRVLLASESVECSFGLQSLRPTEPERNGELSTQAKIRFVRPFTTLVEAVSRTRPCMYRPKSRPIPLTISTGRLFSTVHSPVTGGGSHQNSKHQ